MIVAAGPLADPAPEILARFGKVVVAETDSTEALRPLLAEAVGLVARGPTVVDAELLSAAPRLRVIGRSGVGTDKVDLEAATARGIPVVITPGANASAVAEGAIALLLAMIKRLPALDAAVRGGRWEERDSLAPGDVAGTTLAVVGYGAIGRRVAELARGLGMEVLVCDPMVNDSISLEEALARADHLTLHVPLTNATRGLVSRELLERARPGLRIVNMSRGAVAPLDVLHEGIASGRLAGVGLDVFEPEPPDPAHPLFDHDGVICSPHALALTPAAKRAVFAAMSEGMAAVLDGGRAPHVANPSVYGQ
ncbi:MAG: NAD(P)-dependent oxidoreductase [Thermoleophilaceae bacterium]